MKEKMQEKEPFKKIEPLDELRIDTRKSIFKKGLFKISNLC